MKSKILIIVEGKKTEPQILGNKTHGLLSLIGADYEIVVFENPIYELYEAYEKNEYDDLILYLRTEKGLKIDANLLSKNAFSAVYLIFDFEPHYQKYSDNKIKKMLKTFNNETELGKLYINYPMIEAYYHLKSLPDNEYYNRLVNLNNFTGKLYKKEVNEVTKIKKNRISNKELCYIIMHNYNKVIIITGSQKIDYNKILEIQLDKKNKSNCIFVLSTLALLPLDYNYNKTIEILKLKLKDKYLEIDV